jgi:hypothetical protein
MPYGKEQSENRDWRLKISDPRFSRRGGIRRYKSYLQFCLQNLMKTDSETVEKVPKQILGRDAE